MNDQPESTTQPLNYDGRFGEPQISLPETDQKSARLGILGTFWKVQFKHDEVARSIAAGGQVLNALFFALVYLMFLVACLYVILLPLFVLFSAPHISVSSADFLSKVSFNCLVFSMIVALIGFLIDMVFYVSFCYWVSRLRVKQLASPSAFWLCFLYARSALSIDCGIAISAMSLVCLLYLSNMQPATLIGEFDGLLLYLFIWVLSVLGLLFSAGFGSILCLSRSCLIYARISALRGAMSQ